ncbi:hypothetical protein HN51_035157 [Arachis hypogaea]
MSTRVATPKQERKNKNSTYLTLSLSLSPHSSGSKIPKMDENNAKDTAMTAGETEDTAGASDQASKLRVSMRYALMFVEYPFMASIEREPRKLYGCRVKKRN